MEKISEELAIEQKTYQSLDKKIKNISDLKKEIEKNLKKETSLLLKVIMTGTIILDSSDIHIEPEEERAKIRIRIDGILYDVIFIEKKIYQNLLSRIKLLSGLKLNIEKKAQDGRFSIVLPAEEIETRVSSLPSEYGESIVARILRPKKLIKIEDLGIRKDVLSQFKEEIKKLNGLIIVTGPTGSGKTTTLYSILKRINRPEIKIITIEDPIEYHIPGISQTQVEPDKGYSFASGLKSIVRQDPDVILVGEIRDEETVNIALQAALTGHLVLTTLHTNDASGTIARLQSLGGKIINIAPAINIAIAQRLVRTVCQHCIKFVKPNKEELDFIKKGLKKIDKKITVPKIGSNLRIPKAQGCEKCNFTGYKGRTGIFEFFLVDEEMERFIAKKPSSVELHKKALEKGMTPMRQDGLIKVLKGITTLEEIKRITQQ
jgi:type II secretory ATPase GspE/PulE/Tfp pilus assembly ATPase PilB-like protein